MPRQRTGTVYEASGKWYVRLTLGGRRESIPLPTCTSRDAAKQRKALLNDLARKLGAAGREDIALELLDRAAARGGKALDEVRRAVNLIASGKVVPTRPGKAPTIRELGQRWTSGELARLYPDHVKEKRSSDNDVSRLERYVYPVVGDVRIDAFTLDDAEAVMRGGPAERAAATRRHVAQLLHRLCAMAIFPLRFIAASPLPRGFLPKVGPGKAKGWLYPDEDATLVACASIPLAWRIFYGFLHREGMRHNEAASLTWSDLDHRGAISLDENKTDDPRAWALSPGVNSALRAWRALRAREGAPTGEDALVFVDEQGRQIGERHGAERYRKHLAAAGINRTNLFERTSKRQPIRIHDTRATFITISLANGKSEAWVQDRTGHKSSIMINRYRRVARQAPSPTDSAAAAPASAAAVPAPSRETPRETPEPSHLNAETRSRHYHKTASKQLVAPPGLEPGRPRGQGILKANRGIRTVAIRSILRVLTTVRDGRRGASPIRGSLSPIGSAPLVLLFSR
jgi:integrase